MIEDDTRPNPLSWTTRLLLGASAFGLTAAYAASFLWIWPLDSFLARLAIWVGIGSGASWFAFGAALLGPGKRYAAPLEWADACLRTMLVGNTILLASAALNASGYGADGGAAAGWTHLAILLVADASMATTFALQARRLGAPAAFALGWYAGALNGAFAVVLAASKALGAW